MNTQDSSLPSVDLIESEQATYIEFVFGEKLDRVGAERAILAWKAILDQHPGRSFLLVWDCTQMKDYDHGARSSWQLAMKKNFDRIELIYLISDSKVIQLGASLITMFTKHRIKSVNKKADFFADLELVA